MSMTSGIRAADQRLAIAGITKSGTPTNVLAPNSRAVMGDKGQGQSPLMAAGLNSKVIPSTAWSTPVNSSTRRSHVGNVRSIIMSPAPLHTCFLPSAYRLLPTAYSHTPTLPHHHTPPHPH